MIDCGANIDIFAAMAAAYGMEVYAFEAIEKSVKFLSKVKNILKFIFVSKQLRISQG